MVPQLEAMIARIERMPDDEQLLWARKIQTWIDEIICSAEPKRITGYTNPQKKQESARCSDIIKKRSNS